MDKTAVQGPGRGSLYSQKGLQKILLGQIWRIQGFCMVELYLCLLVVGPLHVVDTRYIFVGLETRDSS